MGASQPDNWTSKFYSVSETEAISTDSEFTPVLKILGKWDMVGVRIFLHHLLNTVQAYKSLQDEIELNTARRDNRIKEQK